MNAEEKGKFFEEVSRNLQMEGFKTESLDCNGLLPVLWHGQLLCKVTAEGGVRYLPDDVRRIAGDEAVWRVTDIAKITAQYMTLIESAPPLKANDDYRLLSEFNNTVLAGQPTSHGVQFVTFELGFDKTGLCLGHYFKDYESSKLDFATRSGLVAKNRLFSAEQLTEVYRAVHETMDCESPITEKRKRLLKGIVEQIKQIVPDMQERVVLSRQEELAAGMPDA